MEYQDFHEIKMDGKFWIEKKSDCPIWNTDDVSRLVYNENTEKLCIGTASNFVSGAYGVGIYGDDDCVIRRMVLAIDDSATANEIKCDISNDWNGDDTGGWVDEIGKGEVKFPFFLSGNGDAIVIYKSYGASSFLSGNALAVISADILTNETGTNLIVDCYAQNNNISVVLRDAASGASVDITSLVDGGKQLIVGITYITDN